MRTTLILGLLTLLLAACMPEEDNPLSLHDIALYEGTDNILYGYFYGDPASVTVGGQERRLEAGSSDDPLAVPGALLVDGEPYLQKALPHLGGRAFEVARAPLSSDLVVRTHQAVDAILYYDGSLWFTLIEDAAAGIDTTVVPRQRVDGLRGLGQLTSDEARVIQSELERQGPLVVAVLETPVEARRPVSRLDNYRNTTLVMQTDIATDPTATRPTVWEIGWRELASGTQAAGDEGHRYALATGQSQLTSLWNKSQGTRLSPAPVPDVDFRRDTVLGIFLGTKPTGGYGVEVRDITVEGDAIYASIEITEPAPDAITTQALTHPWTMVSINRANLQTVWVRDADTGDILGVARPTQ